MEKFGLWLTDELKKRNMNQSDLARASNITTAQISRIISGRRGVGEQALTAIAHALRLPPDLVFEKAGILPPKPELSPIKRAKALDEETRAETDAEHNAAVMKTILGTLGKQAVHIPAWLNQNDPANTNRILHLLLESIVIHPGHIEIRFRK